MPEAYSRKRRLTQSAAEKKLTEALGMLSAFGITFRRQGAKGSPVIDFVSDEAKLVVEIDANQEPDARQARYNATRTTVLEARGYRFLRFWMQDVARNLAQVMTVVMAALREQNDRLSEAKAASLKKAAEVGTAPEDPSGKERLPRPRRRSAAGLG
jgi:very-short-patch-repair endonuclease